MFMYSLRVIFFLMRRVRPIEISLDTEPCVLCGSLCTWTHIHCLFQAMGQSHTTTIAWRDNKSISHMFLESSLIGLILNQATSCWVLICHINTIIFPFWKVFENGSSVPLGLWLLPPQLTNWRARTGTCRDAFFKFSSFFYTLEAHASPGFACLWRKYGVEHHRYMHQREHL